MFLTGSTVSNSVFCCCTSSMTLSMNFWFNGQNGTASTKPAVPPSFKSKGKPPVTKPAEEDEEKLLFQRHRTHGLPKNTYMLNDIEEILLVADIEEAIDLSVGPENVSAQERSVYCEVHRYNTVFRTVTHNV